MSLIINSKFLFENQNIFFRLKIISLDKKNLFFFKVKYGRGGRRSATHLLEGGEDLIKLGTESATECTQISLFLKKSSLLIIKIDFF
jgi:hypothetical protein